MDILATDLAWLAGIIDGEGNFYVNSKTAKINGVQYLDAKIRISSTDMKMIRKISEIYVAMNLRFHYACVNWNHPDWKRAISINITAQGSALNLLNHVNPYLVNKHGQGMAMHRIITFVKSYPKGGNTTRHNYWDTPKMRKLLAVFEECSKWYFEPSTTTRKANSVFEFGDIV